MAYISSLEMSQVELAKALDAARTEIDRLRTQLAEAQQQLASFPLSARDAMRGEILDDVLARNATLEARVRELEGDASWLYGRCPECGHRMAFAADHCPQCRVAFGPPSAYASVDYPENCECARCVGVRAGTKTWTDPLEEDAALTPKPDEGGEEKS